MHPDATEMMGCDRRFFQKNPHRNYVLRKPTITEMEAVLEQEDKRPAAGFEVWVAVRRLGDDESIRLVLVAPRLRFLHDVGEQTAETFFDAALGKVPPELTKAVVESMVARQEGRLQ